MNKEQINRELSLLKRRKLERLQMHEWRTNPMAWLEERFGENPSNFRWSDLEGYENHEWDGDADPLVKAWEVIGNAYKQVSEGKDPDKRYVAVEAATGTSKTYWLARLIFWFLDCFENSLVVTSAPKQDQLKLGLWSEISKLSPKVKKLRPDSKLFKLRLAMDNSGTTTDDLEEAQNLDAWHAIGFVAGVGADEVSSDKARGFHRQFMLIILEECTGMPLPTLTAFQNTSTGMTNYIVAVGNPSNEFDPLHVFSQQPDVESIRISAFDYPNIVLNKEMFAGAVTHVSIKSRTDVYGKGSQVWNAMIRGISPTQSVDSLIQIDWLNACIDLEIEHYDYEYNAAGVDVANSPTGDKASVAYGQGPILRNVEEFQCPNATHLAYNLIYTPHELAGHGYTDYNIPTMYDYGITDEYIGIDSVGVGVATVNGFLDKGFPEVQSLSGGAWIETIPKTEYFVSGNPVEKPMYSFANLRSQMYWELREDIRNKRISFRLEDRLMLQQLLKELTIPKYKADGIHIEVERKPDIKKRMGGKSPNVADAVAYWNWTRKGYRVNNVGFLPVG